MMKVKYVDCLIMFHLLNHIKLSDGDKTLSDSIKIKVKKQIFYLYDYPVDFENFKSTLTDELLTKYSYDNLLKNEEGNEPKLSTIDLCILTEFSEERIKKLCDFVEIEDIDYFTYKEYSEILELNINNGDFYIPYVFFEPLSADDFINLLAVYLTDFNKKSED
ncbi:MAG: hypothetical protein IJH39_12140 [Clostridia bacterium]|nr:hypothetical protein [Clostridia bacterium]